MIITSNFFQMYYFYSRVLWYLSHCHFLLYQLYSRFKRILNFRSFYFGRLKECLKFQKTFSFKLYIFKPLMNNSLQEEKHNWVKWNSLKASRIFNFFIHFFNTLKSFSYFYLLLIWKDSILKLLTYNISHKTMYK